MRDQNVWLTLLVEDETPDGEVRISIDRRITYSTSRETHAYIKAARPITAEWLADAFANLLTLEEASA
jgi:hypothetical protein